MPTKNYYQIITGAKWIIIIVIVFIGALYLQESSTPQAFKTHSSEALQRWMIKFSIAKAETPKRIPNAIFYNQDGKSISLTKYQGKEIMIVVWATWCGPCREEMPYLNTIMPELALQGIELLPISVDTGGAADIKKFYNSLDIERLPILFDSGIDLLEALEIGPIPTIIIVNDKGYELGRRIGKVPGFN